MNHVELNNLVNVRGADGFFQLEKDKEAVALFAEEVRSKSMKFSSILAKIDYLIENNYYEDFYSKYSRKEVESVYTYTKQFGFKFPSYMSITKFYDEYALKTDDKETYLEDYHDRVASVSLHLGDGDVQFALRLAVAMMEQRLQPATPTFLNAGKSRRGELVSCYLLEMDDSLNSINYVLGTCMQLSKIGGGVAVNLSKLRGRGEPIKGVKGAAKGIVPVLKLMEDAFSYADQMGQRKGSGAAYYHIFGWDVQEFLDTKKSNADEKIRLKTLSIGLIVPSIFYDLARRNEDLYVFAPYSVYKEYGTHLDEMDLDNMYYELLENPNVKKKVVSKAREMLTSIAITQLESGYPYIMNKTNANNQHALKGLGQIKMSNLCTEIFQLQETSEINDYGTPNVYKRDISCNLATLNIDNVMENKAIKQSVFDGIDALTVVSDKSKINNAPGIQKANEEIHSVGLGAMNLHGYLAKNRIAYESQEAKEFANTFFMMMNFYSIQRSMEIARDRGVTFKDFSLSEYASGKYFHKYIEKDFYPKSKKVWDLFEGIDIPSPGEWADLMHEVMEHGLYHGYRLAIAPNGSIAYLQNATPSVMPVVEPIETRANAVSTTYFPMPFLTPETFFYYKSAYNMDQFKVLELVAVISQHIDQGVSTILHVNSDVSTRTLGILYAYADFLELRSLYYTRTKRLSVEECSTCVV